MVMKVVKREYGRDAEISRSGESSEGDWITAVAHKNVRTKPDYNFIK